MKEIKNITVNYDNNESKVITKGVAINFREKDDGDIETCFNMCNIKGKDLDLIIESIVELSLHLGIINEEGE